MVNPRACHETELKLVRTTTAQKIIVVGSGPSGLAFAITAAEKGHQVTLYEKSSRIGGQFNLAKLIPGKDEFYETIRYYKEMLEKYKVKLKLSQEFTIDSLKEEPSVQHIVIASGIEPRVPRIEGIEHPVVSSYIDVLTSRVKLGKKIAIIGGGAIGFDVAEFLSHPLSEDPKNIDTFLSKWGVDKKVINPGGVLPDTTKFWESEREVYLFKRSEGKFGKNLGKTTGWIHRSTLKKRNVKMIGSVQYKKIDDSGLHFEKSGKLQTIKFDNIVICAGQTPSRYLYDKLENLTLDAKTHLIGGAFEAKELDAKHAINQGVRLALSI